MTEQVADPVESTTPEAEATEQVADPKGLENESEIATARKRQAGADAARAAAERERDAVRKELEGYKAREREQQDAGLSESAKLQQALEAEKRRADEAEARANAKVLDKLYPNARKELPEVTDEVRLAKFEAMLKDGDESPADVARAMRAPKDASPGKPREESSKDILAKLMTMSPDY